MKRLSRPPHPHPYAVPPGFGFLARTRRFAEMPALPLISPSWPHGAIELMGNKRAAEEQMAAVVCPSFPVALAGSVR
ncbi:MAG: hypothetical protein IPL78_32870 [Chloroflexi bacterium]|nr:hypothetical protein [Chloroflexota bacterium]